MAIDELEAELKAVESKLVTSSAQMERLLQSFATSIAPDVSSWIDEAAVRSVEENHEATIAGGLEFVRAVREDVTALKRDAVAISTAALGGQEQWPHNKELTASEFYSKNTDFFGAVHRRAVSSLGKVLSKHGLLNPSDRSWQRGIGGRYEYAYHSGFEAKKYAEIGAYQDLLKDHHALKVNAARLRTLIEKSKARALWDDSAER